MSNERASDRTAKGLVDLLQRILDEPEKPIIIIADPQAYAKDLQQRLIGMLSAIVSRSFISKLDFYYTGTPKEFPGSNPNTFTIYVDHYFDPQKECRNNQHGHDMSGTQPILSTCYLSTNTRFNRVLDEYNKQLYEYNKCNRLKLKSR